MDAITAMTRRRTTPPAKMTEEGPDDEQLAAMLEAAAAAPDHGRLRPWRFVLVRGERRADLGELFAKALKTRRSDALDRDVLKQKSAPMRAPLLVVVIAKIDAEHAKIPADEQRASAAAATQNLLVAAEALGFASKWATGDNATDATVRAGFGLGATDEITGFVYVGGKPEEPFEGSPRPDLAEVVREWRGAAR